MLDAGESFGYAFDDRRRGFLQVVRGTVEIDGETIETGDAIAVVDQQALDIKAKSDAELLLFDMV